MKEGTRYSAVTLYIFIIVFGFLYVYFVSCYLMNPLINVFNIQNSFVEVDEDFKIVDNYKYKLITKLQNKCDQASDIVFLIHSVFENKKFRDSIRKTWGQENRIIQNSTFHAKIKRVFIMSQVNTFRKFNELERESRTHQDMVIVDYIDFHYYNTIKIIIGLKWSQQYCNNGKFYVITNDRSYFNIRNLFKYLDSLEVVKDDDKLFDKFSFMFKNNSIRKPCEKIETKFYGGLVYNNEPVIRGRSEVALTSEEYPYNYYNKYATSSCIILSNSVIAHLLEAAKYTRIFKTADAYLGLLATRLRIPIKSIPGIFRNHAMSNQSAGLDKAISAHNIHYPQDITLTWMYQEKRGHA